MLWATAANATVINDTALSPPGVFFGSGNINAHWTVDNEAGGIQLGIQGLERFIGPYTPDAGTSVYHAAAGQTSVSGKTGSVWDVAFSVNTGSSLLSSFTANLCLTDVGTGGSGCFNVLTIPDNAISGNIAQNAEALSFSATGAASLFAVVLGDSLYNINADDTYLFTLSLLNSAGATIGSVGATIITGAGVPVPEPGSVTLLGGALLGFAALRRGRRRPAA